MSEPVRISLRIPGTAPMPELITLIQDIEAAGFDGAGILDSQLLCRDTYVTMALAATQTPPSGAAQPWLAGIGLVSQQLRSVLAAAGLEEIDANGKPFDPHWHEAVSEQEFEDRRRRWRDGDEALRREFERYLASRGRAGPGYNGQD